jgi:hypothetical protein
LRNVCGSCRPPNPRGLFCKQTSAFLSKGAAFAPREALLKGITQWHRSARGWCIFSWRRSCGVLLPLMNVSTALRSFALLAAITCCDARALHVLSQTFSVSGSWQESVGPDSSWLPPTEPFTSGTFGQTSSTPFTLPFVNPNATNTANVTFTPTSLQMTSNARLYGSPIPTIPGGYIDRNTIDFTASLATSFIPEGTTIVLQPKIGVVYFYTALQQSVQISLRDATTGTSMLDYSIFPLQGQTYETPFTFSGLNPAHTYEAVLTGQVRSFDGDKTTLNASLVISASRVSDTGSSLAMLVAVVGCFAVWRRVNR